MSQATKSNTYRNGSEPMDNGSKPMDSEMNMEDIIESMKHFADPILVIQVEEGKAMLKKAEEKIRDLKDTCADQSVELHKIKKENEEIYRKLKEQEESGKNIDFYPIYDPRMYSDESGRQPSPKWIHNLWDTLYTHSTYTLDDGSYYIENTTSALVIYKIMRESNRIAYQFVGKYDDFCITWNANLASRHENQDRVVLLTCKGDTIKALYNNRIWKNVSIGAIERNINLKAAHKNTYRKANCIITHVMPDIKALASE